MTGQSMTKQELLRFKLTAYLRSEENKRSIAAHKQQRFEEEAARMLAHISELFADEPGIEVTTMDSFSSEVDSNVGWLQIDIVGKIVRISPALKDGERILEVSGLSDGSYAFELEHDEWRASPPASYGWVRPDDDFWFTKLAELVPK